MPATRRDMDPIPTCPFCGVAADAPHETQEGCIQALHEEIARMRAVLGQVYSAVVPRPPDDEGSESGDS